MVEIVRVCCFSSRTCRFLYETKHHIRGNLSCVRKVECVLQGTLGQRVLHNLPPGDREVEWPYFSIVHCFIVDLGHRVPELHLPQCHFCFLDVHKVVEGSLLHHVDIGWTSLEGKLDLTVRRKEFTLLQHIQVRFSYQSLEGLPAACSLLALKPKFSAPAASIWLTVSLE